MVVLFFLILSVSLAAGEIQGYGGCGLCCDKVLAKLDSLEQSLKNLAKENGSHNTNRPVVPEGTPEDSPEGSERPDEECTDIEQGANVFDLRMSASGCKPGHSRYPREPASPSPLAATSSSANAYSETSRQTYLHGQAALPSEAHHNLGYIQPGYPLAPGEKEPFQAATQPSPGPNGVYYSPGQSGYQPGYAENSASHGVSSNSHRSPGYPPAPGGNTSLKDFRQPSPGPNGAYYPPGQPGYQPGYVENLAPNGISSVSHRPQGAYYPSEQPGYPPVSGGYTPLKDFREPSPGPNGAYYSPGQPGYQPGYVENLAPNGISSVSHRPQGAYYPSEQPGYPPVSGGYTPLKDFREPSRVPNGAYYPSGQPGYQNSTGSNVVIPPRQPEYIPVHEGIVPPSEPVDRSVHKASEKSESTKYPLGTEPTEEQLALGENNIYNSCHEVTRPGKYLIRNTDGIPLMNMICDTVPLSNGQYEKGWIVVQNRFNGSVSFYRTWEDYVAGFGNLDGEFWMGLDLISKLVNNGFEWELMFRLTSFQGETKYQRYRNLKIGDATDEYTLKMVSGGGGTAGDSFSRHRGSMFTTYDRDNDKSKYNCAKKHEGGWWYHNQCATSNLNGIYTNAKGENTNFWHTMKPAGWGLKATRIMIRFLLKN